jgi:hypothetical protein
MKIRMFYRINYKIFPLRRPKKTTHTKMIKLMLQYFSLSFFLNVNKKMIIQNICGFQKTRPPTKLIFE